MFDPHKGHDEKRPGNVKNNVAQTVKKHRPYKQHPAVTDMIDKANSAMEENQWKG